MSTPVTKIHSVKLLGNEGDELVVLSHGMGGSQDSWELVIPHLLPRYRVMIFNLQGHHHASASAPDDDEDEQDSFDISRYKSLHGFVEDLIQILSELQINKCMYVGHSVSGMIGCLAAAARPDLFAKLILIGASPRYLNDADYEGGFEPDQIEQLLAAIQQDCASWVRGFVPNVVGPDATEESVQQYVSSFLRLKPEFTLVVAEAIFKSDFRQQLSLVEVPCHIIQTEDDFAVPLAVAKFLQMKLGGDLEILKARGHLPHVTCPHLLIPVLKNMLESG